MIKGTSSYHPSSANRLRREAKQFHAYRTLPTYKMSPKVTGQIKTDQAENGTLHRLR